MAVGYVSKRGDRLQRRTMQRLGRDVANEGLDSNAVEAFLQANPDAMRYPSQAADKAKEFARTMGAATAAVDAPYGSIAQRSDPNQYGSVASRSMPGMFGPGSASQQYLQGMRRRSQPAAEQQAKQPAARNYGDVLDADPVERVRARGRKFGVKPLGGVTAGMSNDALRESGDMKYVEEL